MEVPATNGTIPLARFEKKLEAKIEEQIVKSLNNVQPEEKFSTILKKCVESERINKTLVVSQKQNQKLFEGCMREKDALQADLNKTLLTK